MSCDKTRKRPNDVPSSMSLFRFHYEGNLFASTGRLYIFSFSVMLGNFLQNVYTAKLLVDGDSTYFILQEMINYFFSKYYVIIRQVFTMQNPLTLSQIEY